ncbi:hypothetical protein P879_01579 [Paragonimus westermani]|uniref:Folliculin n=1 Tax=Paragonimus westermani TaxID=34504 RepID=A0A8T0DLJ0_9TREM|nr:hypothetical protein P879_01579 [Paragonimus westermani]
MPFAFIRKALGLRKINEDKEFDEFLKYFERPDNYYVNNLHKGLRRSVRCIVLGNEGRKVFYDSLSYKDTHKSLPVFSVGLKQTNLAEFVFGSDLLSTTKDLLYSIKVHDVSSTGQLLITRFVSDLDDWRALQTSGRRHFVSKRSSSSVPQLPCRSEVITQNSAVVCVILNLEGPNSQTSQNANKMGNSSSGLSSRRSVTSVAAEEKQACRTSDSSVQRSMDVTAKRFYRMLFEHCAPLSVMLETLATDAFMAVSKTTKGQWVGAGAQCAEAISSAYETFIKSFRDFCAPRLSFPIWSTLNNTLYVTSDTTGSHIDRVSSWLNMDCDCSFYPDSYDGNTLATYDSLVNSFLRCCINPLISRGGREHRYFLGQLITGILMLHPGWVASLTSSPTASPLSPPISPLHSSGCTVLPNVLLSQLLMQAGCMDTNLECLGGSIFNCTILTGHSRKYLLALLYFATYFLRFTSILFTNEYVPDLGRADLFELEQQKRQSRVGIKARRKSGSAASTCGDAHDSGISSQEDLTVSVYSASTGSSPTHASGMALCMPNRLTRDQCRMAELAAQVAVSREAAAAAGLHPTNFNTVPSKPTTDILNQPDPGALLSGHGTSQSRLTEIPLLIEKYVAGQDDMCYCLPLESYPGQIVPDMCVQPCSSRVSPIIPTGSGSLALYSGMSDSSPALSISATGAAHKSSPPGGTSPRCTAYSVGASQPRPSEAPRAAQPQSAQTTSEHPDSFKTRLTEYLHQWLKLGPLIIRGVNLSTKKVSLTNHIPHRFPHKHAKISNWCASALIANADNKTVEIMTLRQMNARDSDTPPSDLPASTRLHQRPSRHSFSQLSGRWGSKPDLGDGGNGSTTAKRNSPSPGAPPHSLPIEPAPLVLRLIERVHLVCERASCAPLALRDLEGALCVIYQKSRVLADLLIKTGPSLLRDPDRMAAAAGCTTNDVPLLLSTAASYCVQAAAILTEYHSDWWIG